MYCHSVLYSIQLYLQQYVNYDNLDTKRIQKKTMPPHFHIILYVADQQKSCDFYTDILRQQPTLHVPGMTEFMLNDTLTLGLMPENGIAKILGTATAHPATGSGIPRCELYIRTDLAEEMFNRALQAGGSFISGMELRSWGESAGYIADPDGHIIAFAQKKN